MLLEFCTIVYVFIIFSTNFIVFFGDISWFNEINTIKLFNNNEILNNDFAEINYKVNFVQWKSKIFWMKYILKLEKWWNNSSLIRLLDYLSLFVFLLSFKSILHMFGFVHLPAFLDWKIENIKFPFDMLMATFNL